MTSVSQEQKNSEYLEAAEEGELETLVTLLDAGADIKCKDKYGNSALHLAAEEGNDDIVKILVDRGLDVNIRGRNEWTPLIKAAAYAPPYLSPPWRESTVNTLIAAGADITCTDAQGNNALHKAARKGNDTIVKTLVDQGLDVNTRGQYDRTPLMRAAVGGYETTVNILIQAGADITCRDAQGNNALDVAAGHDKIVKTLLEIQTGEL